MTRCSRSVPFFSAFIPEESKRKRTFKENLLQKIVLERLASLVIASCGSEQSTRPVDKEAMRSLLELDPIYGYVIGQLSGRKSLLDLVMNV